MHQVGLLLVLLVSISSAWSKVLELNERFGEVNSQGNWLVMFYAPWCGHCKHLEPTWLEIGRQMAIDSPDVAIARLDATKYSSLTSQYGVRGFPTIKFFKFGRQFEYNGARTKQSIMSFALRAKGPEVLPLKSVLDLKQAKKDKPVFYLYVGDDNTALKSAYNKAASLLFTNLDFYSCPKSFLPKEINTELSPTVLVFKDEKYYEIPKDGAEAGAIDIWIRLEQFPSYNHLTGSSYHSLNSARRRFAIAVVDGNKQMNSTLQSVALERRYPFIFCWIEDNKIANSMTYSTILSPNLLVYDGQSYEYFVLNDEDKALVELSENNMRGFLDDVKMGKITGKGGRGFWQQVKRSISDFLFSIVGMFQESPIITSLVIIVPTVLIIGMCVCLCTITDDGEPVEDYRSSDEEDDEPPPYKSDVEGVDPDEDLPEQELDPTAGGEGVRRRIREENISQDQE
uniref:Protein disulfide-isomerase TMX3-like n=1 Tax=Phallusia mammillata TaxID=59560 RepID=A0A6F9DVY4_9ASCI|nr:protein disulfide-isomerase TMX3-like [Phallusia mammillata]